MRQSVLCLSVLIFAPCVFADIYPIYLTPVAAGNWTGSRTSGGYADAADGLIGPSGGGWIVANQFQISWQISLASGVYKYQYTVTEPTSTQGALSHFLLELSRSCEETPSACMFNIIGDVSSDSPKLWTEANGNPSLPANIYGAKFGEFADNHPWVFSFDSYRQPMWGNFYAKDGEQAGWVSNAGLADLDSASIIDFIPVPDTVSPIPEPASVVLLVTVAGVICARARYNFQPRG